MRSFAPGTSLIDLLFMGHAEYIACYVLETAGGLVIALIGMSMLHSRKSNIHASGAPEEDTAAKPSIAVVPLAMPVVAGPGTIVTVIRK